MARLCDPIYTEVDDINEVRRALRQINQCLGDVTVDIGGGAAECFQAYEGKGGQLIDQDISTVRFNTVDINTNGSVMSWSDALSELTINKNGKFEFQYRVTVGESTSSEVQCSGWLERDTGTGWEEVPGSRVFVHTKAAP